MKPTQDGFFSSMLRRILSRAAGVEAEPSAYFLYVESRSTHENVTAEGLSLALNTYRREAEIASRLPVSASRSAKEGLILVTPRMFEFAIASTHIKVSDDQTMFNRSALNLDNSLILVVGADEFLALLDDYRQTLHRLHDAIALEATLTRQEIDLLPQLGG